MAVVGPLASIAIGIIFLALSWAAGYLGWPLPVTGVLVYLMWLNFILAAFNLIPAFPLDGGRMLRAVLWRVKGDLRWATRVASAFGAGFGILLIVWGVLAFISGNVIGGAWYFLIGLFIRNASRMSYRQMVIRQALAGEPVRRFMNSEPVVVPADQSIQNLVENYVYKYHHKMFPVTEDGHLRGCVTTGRIKEIEAAQRAAHRVEEITQPCTGENTVDPETDAMEAMSLMNRTGSSRLMVVKNNHLEGIITLKDLLKFLALKIDLEGEKPIPLTNR